MPDEETPGGPRPRQAPRTHPDGRSLVPWTVYAPAVPVEDRELLTGEEPLQLNAWGALAALLAMAGVAGVLVNVGGASEELPFSPGTWALVGVVALSGFTSLALLILAADGMVSWRPSKQVDRYRRLRERWAGQWCTADSWTIVDLDGPRQAVTKAVTSRAVRDGDIGPEVVTALQDELALIALAHHDLHGLTRPADDPLRRRAQAGIDDRAARLLESCATVTDASRMLSAQDAARRQEREAQEHRDAVEDETGRVLDVIARMEAAPRDRLLEGRS